ncbi:hypothetical protein KAZ57_01460 [Patescibacteria group bacterium]|nr:hypothetical protein [Patescibacteria group bacterium]
MYASDAINIGTVSAVTSWLRQQWQLLNSIPEGETILALAEESQEHLWQTAENLARLHSALIGVTTTMPVSENAAVNARNVLMLVEFLGGTLVKLEKTQELYGKDLQKHGQNNERIMKALRGEFPVINKALKQARGTVVDLAVFVAEFALDNEKLPHATRTVINTMLDAIEVPADFQHEDFHQAAEFGFMDKFFIADALIRVAKIYAIWPAAEEEEVQIPEKNVEEKAPSEPPATPIVEKSSQSTHEIVLEGEKHAGFPEEPEEHQHIELELPEITEKPKKHNKKGKKGGQGNLVEMFDDEEKVPLTNRQLRDIGIPPSDYVRVTRNPNGHKTKNQRRARERVEQWA